MLPSTRRVPCPAKKSWSSHNGWRLQSDGVPASRERLQLPLDPGTPGVAGDVPISIRGSTMARKFQFPVVAVDRTLSVPASDANGHMETPRNSQSPLVAVDAAAVRILDRPVMAAGSDPSWATPVQVHHDDEQDAPEAVGGDAEPHFKFHLERSALAIGSRQHSFV